jgi:hypothetical protein
MEQARRRRDVLALRVRGVGGEHKGERSGEKEERRTTVCPPPRFRGGGEGKAGGIGGGFLLCVIIFREPTRLLR